jgi:predicted ABC-type ATPase
VCVPGRIEFPGVPFNSYHASVLADFLRRRLLDAGRSFTFETVMSAPDKVRLLGEAQANGFRTYLYYIATESPEINVERVKNRVSDGGHDVPTQKVVERYHRSLALLPSAIRATNRAYLFDTSEEEAWYFAEVTEGTRIELKGDEMPLWFEPIWNAFGSEVPSSDP